MVCVNQPGSQKKYITTKHVEDFIDFQGANKSVDIKIAKLQSEGVAALYDILCDKKFAYLADEVGMGKTYEGIGVMAMVLKKKANAKILIMTPSSGVQKKWAKDYESFLDNNLKDHEDFPQANIYERILDYVDNRDNQISILRTTSFSNVLSNFGVEIGDEDIEINKIINKIGKIFEERNIAIPEVDDLKEVIKSQKSKENIVFYIGILINFIISEYDLLIVDEAQNIRNENILTRLFNSMFGLQRNMRSRDEKMHNLIKKYTKNKVKKLLFISATPAHNSYDDIKNQLRYVIDNTNENEINDNLKNLDKFMIRRLRLFKDKTKYEYRIENAVDVNNKMNSQEKLFIALLQKKLDITLGSNNRSENKNIYKIGFLEAFESYPEYGQDNISIKSEDNDKEKSEFTDVDKNDNIAPDKQTMLEINRSFTKHFSKNSSIKYPPHPKHTYLEEDIKNKFNNQELDKELIFVRRIPSVRELCGRLNSVYDEYILEHISKIININIDNIEKFDRILNGAKDYDDNEDYNDMNEYEEENQSNDEEYYYKSKVLMKFVYKKKEKKGDSSNLSLGNFRMKFNNNKSLAPIFEENYIKSCYDYLKGNNTINNKYDEFINDLIDERYMKELRKYLNKNILKTSKLKRVIFKNTELFNIINNIGLYMLKNKYSEISNLYEFHRKFYKIEKNKNENEAIETPGENSIKEHLKLESFWNKLSNISQYDLHNIILNNESKRSYEENIRRYEVLKLLLGKSIKLSDGIVDLACTYVNLNNTNSNKASEKESRIINLNKYADKFIKYLESKNGKKLKDRIQKFIKEFDLIRKQLYTDAEYKRIFWDDRINALNYQHPVMGVIGGQDSKDAIVAKFNTPFFPDIIVCTDVLKEGIDLHLFCDKVCHYGLAWSPGDLEQRVGRVDRFFSQAYRKIMNDEEGNVNINYPYMGNTIDEQQVGKVLKNKKIIEPKLDKGELVDLSKSINSENIESCNISKLLENNSHNVDHEPYSAKRYLKSIGVE